MQARRGVDLKTARPKVERGSHCQSVSCKVSGVRGFSRVERRSTCSAHETVCWMHFHGGTPPDISGTVPSDLPLARC